MNRYFIWPKILILKAPHSAGQLGSLITVRRVLWTLQSTTALDAGRRAWLCWPSGIVLGLLDHWSPGPFAMEEGTLMIDAEGNRVI